MHDARVALIAARQHGLITRAQLRQLGLGVGAIDHRLGMGRLHPVHRGVYAVGHRRLTQHGRWLAAVLACGAEGALSHESAAALWRMRETAGRPIDVTIRSTSHRQVGGLTLHRSRTLAASMITRHEGIPVTTPARTLIDLATDLPRRELERALDEAHALKLVNRATLTRTVEEADTARGAGRLAAYLVEHEPGSSITRSALEERFLVLCAQAGIPRPRVNVSVEGLTVDFMWPLHRLIVETDGYRYHHHHRAFERDRRRDQRLVAAGWRVVRFTSRQVIGDAGSVTRVLNDLMP